MLNRPGLHLRAALFSSVRRFFCSRGFLEVDTPVRQPVIIPESAIRPLIAEGQYLQASPELCMKRILASGSGSIFQICRCFRKGERGRLHLEEFSMLEWYRCDADYRQLMDDCEELLSAVAADMNELAADPGCGTLAEPFPGLDITTRPWPRLQVAEAFTRFSPVSLEQSMGEDRFEEMLVEYVEPHLGTAVPAFLIDYPVELGSLAKRKVADPSTVERFELYADGIELANGFSELTDPVEQRRRFTVELEAIAGAGLAPAGMPERFLEELQNLPACAGIALGLDRLLMLLTGERSIDRVVPFAPDDF